MWNARCAHSGHVCAIVNRYGATLLHCSVPAVYIAYLSLCISQRSHVTHWQLMPMQHSKTRPRGAGSRVRYRTAQRCKHLSQRACCVSQRVTYRSAHVVYVVRCQHRTRQRRLTATPSTRRRAAALGQAACASRAARSIARERTSAPVGARRWGAAAVPPLLTWRTQAHAGTITHVGLGGPAPSHRICMAQGGACNSSCASCRSTRMSQRTYRSAHAHRVAQWRLCPARTHIRHTSATASHSTRQQAAALGETTHTRRAAGSIASAVGL